MRFGFWEILLIVLLVFLLFGANRFPAMMKNLADGLKVFRKEVGEKPDKSKPAPKKSAKKKK
jgi:sec-independent protein translocase protein TatA